MKLSLREQANRTLLNYLLAELVNTQPTPPRTRRALRLPPVDRRLMVVVKGRAA